jgi:oligosaccharide repeat unit polymerase
LYSATILILGLLPTLMFALVARIDRAGAIGPSPMKIMAWTFLLGYTLKSIYLSYAVVHDLPFRPDWIAFHIIHIGQIAVLTATVAIIVGYAGAMAWLGRFANRTGLPRRWPLDIRLIYFPMFALSIVLMVAFFYQMGFFQQIASGRLLATKFFIDESGERSSLGFLNIGGDFILVFFIYYLAMARRITWLNIYTISLAFVVLTLFLGSRRNVILVILILAIIVLAVRGVRPDLMKKVIRLGIVALVLIGVSFASQIRSTARDGSTLANLDIGVAIQTSAIHAFEGAYFIDPAKTAAIIETVDSTVDLLWGSSFVSILFAPIPRVLWPEKPSVRVGPFVAQYLFDFGNQAGVPPGAVGELYLNFGWIGIPLGMIVLGAFMAFLWWRHSRAVDPRFTIARYAFLMIAVIYFLTVEFAAAFVIFIKYYIAIVVAERYWMYELSRQPRLDTRIMSTHRISTISTH